MQMLKFASADRLIAINPGDVSWIEHIAGQGLRINLKDIPNREHVVTVSGTSPADFDNAVAIVESAL